jgi:ABC-type branched-subunit amino acid transport system ATPase component
VSLLVVERVAKHFAGVHAVDGVSFALAQGELAALIGPNGAGKSTLFGVVAGQHAASAGDVRFEGRSIVGKAPAALARLGIGRTFQTARVFASMTVVENVQLALAAREGKLYDGLRSLWRYQPAQAAALLDRVGLRQAAGTAAASLGYGDVKRLEFAIALAGAPRLLLMDEPTAGMAPAERFALMDLVRDIARQSALTVLFTEHSMEVVFGYAERVIVMSRGRLIADGTPDAVRRDPAAQAAYFGEAGVDHAADGAADAAADSAVDAT